MKNKLFLSLKIRWLSTKITFLKFHSRSEIQNKIKHPFPLFSFNKIHFYSSAENQKKASNFNKNVNGKKKLFVSSGSLADKKIIRCVGGKGGDGNISYVRHARHDLVGPGWPCGGGGGIGGNVVVETSNKLYSLSHLNGHVVAEDGRPGGKRNSNGICGKDAYLKVPIGCIVSKIIKNDKITSSTKEKFKKTFLVDLNKPKSCFIVAEGGKGGKGNNSVNPHTCTKGNLGEEVYIEIELKLIGDVGFVGLPNAGKSTLLSAISQARPKIAPYPFTTIAPYIGSVHYEDGLKITVADIPGIIEDSHMNRGLGIDFLRHIERNKILVFVIDAAFHAHEASMETFLLLRREIGAYSPDLLKKKFFIVANKCDVASHKTLPAVDEFWNALQVNFSGIPLIAISARFGDGIPNFISTLRKMFLEVQEEEKQILNSDINDALLNIS